MTKKTIALLLIAVMLCAVGCAGPIKEPENPAKSTAATAIQTEEPTSVELWLGDATQAGYCFDSAQGSKVTADSALADDFLAFLAEQTAAYPHQELFGMEQVLERTESLPVVTTHAFSALNEAGKPDAGYMAAQILRNNTLYLEDHTFGFEDVSLSYATELCGLILQTVEKQQQLCPDMDWDRVWCVLGSMKILNKPGMLAYAQVNADRVLCVSENSASILESMQGEDGLTKVLVHETMHLLQIGCQCEQTGDLERRAGISVAWSDLPLGTTDWTWLVESSAERNMCQVLGTDPTTYDYILKYLATYTMALLPGQADANSLSQLCFYGDMDRLYELFGCETDREQLLLLLIATQLEAMEPQGFLDAYAEATGAQLSENEEAEAAFYGQLRLEICRMLTVLFYENLTNLALTGDLTQEDACLLINLFEAQVHYFLRYTKPESEALCKPFLEEAAAIRERFFGLLGLSGVYEDYTLVNEDGRTLNGTLAALTDEEKSFLLEQATMQADWLILGTKI